MSNCVNYQAQIASIMDILSKAAVAEISKVVDDGFVLLRLEMCRKENEIESLKMKVQSLESDLRTAGRLGEKAPVYSRSVRLGIKLRRAGEKVGADYGEKPPFDRKLFVKDCDPHPTPAAEVQVTHSTPVDDGKKPDTEPTPAGEPKELERVFGQEWSFSLRRDGEPAGVEQVDSPLQSGVTQNQSADMEKVRPEPILIKQESLEEDLCYRDPQPTPTTEEQVTQPTPVEDGKKLDTEPTPAGDPEELSEQHRCEHGDEELSGLEFVVKAEQEEEHVAQRLNQTGYEHSAGRLNNLDSEYVMYERDSQLWTSFTQEDSDIETDDPVCSNAVDQCSQRLSIHTQLHHAPATTEVSGNTLSSFGPSYVEEFDTMSEKPSVGSEELSSEAIHTQQGQYRERLVHTAERENQTLLPQQQQQHGPSVKHMRGSESPAQPHSGSQYETGSSSSVFSAGKKDATHGQPDIGKKPFICIYCGKSFNCCSHLISHHRIHTGEKPYSCAQCGKRFSHKGNLVQHERVHSGNKPFGCTLCGKRFARGPDLRAHHRIHTGEKPYHCTYCGKSFARQCNLVVHQRIHTRVKLYSCI